MASIPSALPIVMNVTVSLGAAKMAKDVAAAGVHLLRVESGVSVGLKSLHIGLVESALTHSASRSRSDHPVSGPFRRTQFIWLLSWRYRETRLPRQHMQAFELPLPTMPT